MKLEQWSYISLFGIEVFKMPSLLECLLLRDTVAPEHIQRYWGQDKFCLKN